MQATIETRGPESRNPESERQRSGGRRRESAGSRCPRGARRPRAAVGARRRRRGGRAARAGAVTRRDSPRTPAQRLPDACRRDAGPHSPALISHGRRTRFSRRRTWVAMPTPLSPELVLVLPEEQREAAIRLYPVCLRRLVQRAGKDRVTVYRSSHRRIIDHLLIFRDDRLFAQTERRSSARGQTNQQRVNLDTPCVEA